MIRTRKYGLAAFAVACGLASPSGLRAQMTPPPPAASGPSMMTGSMLANPYMSPALNPYLNPLAGPTQNPGMARDSAFLYLLSRQAQGGIGSGMIGGSHAPARAATTNRAPAQMPPAAMVPGSNASRYFNSGQGAPNRMNSYYGRRDRVAPTVRR